MEKEKILKEILMRVEVRNEKKYLDCEKATEIATVLNIEKIIVGKICNENGIKIRKCQLGCF